MEFSHVFYKEVSADEDNIFSVNLSKNIDADQIRFDKSKTYAISGLSIDPNIQTSVLLLNVKAKKALRDILRTYVEEKNKFNLDLNVYKKDYFDITVPFVKRTDALINGFKYYDTTTQKEQTIEFYDCYDQLKKFWFYVGHSPLELAFFRRKNVNKKKLHWAKQQGKN